MEITTTSIVSQLTPIECKQKNCYYNNWIISIQQAPEKLSEADKNSIINFHQQLQKVDAKVAIEEKTYQQGNVPSFIRQTFYLEMLTKLDSTSDYVDSCNAFCNHLHASCNYIDTQTYTSFGMLLEASIHLKQQIAKHLAEYIKNQSIPIYISEKNTSIFYALANNQVEILDTLFVLQQKSRLKATRAGDSDIENLDLRKSSLGSRYQDEKGRIDSVINFMKNNIHNPYLQAKIFLNLHLNTCYLTNDKFDNIPNRLEKIFEILFIDDDFKPMLEIISQIVNFTIKTVTLKTIKGPVECYQYNRELTAQGERKYFTLPDQILSNKPSLDLKIPVQTSKDKLIAILKILENNRQKQ